MGVWSCVVAQEGPRDEEGSDLSLGLGWGGVQWVTMRRLEVGVLERRAHISDLRLVDARQQAVAPPSDCELPPPYGA